MAGGLMQLVAYGSAYSAHYTSSSQNTYFQHISSISEEISPRWWGERDQEKVIEKLADKLKTDKACENDCLICMENMKDADLCECKECQILIHYKCLETWLNTKKNCPHCRTKINN